MCTLLVFGVHTVHKLVIYILQRRRKLFRAGGAISDLEVL